MSHQKIIQDLIAWIDEHIDQPLNIDVVAKKSGGDRNWPYIHN